MSIKPTNYTSNNISVCIPKSQTHNSERDGASNKRLYHNIKRIISNRIKHISYYWYLLTGWYKGDRRIIYVISPAFPAPELGYRLYKQNCYPIYVISDEGLGTYCSCHEYRLTDFTKECGLRGLIVYFRKVLLSHKWVKHVFPIIDVCLFVKENKALRINELTKNSYLRAIQNRLSCCDTSQWPNLKSKIILCTTISSNKSEQEEYKRIESDLIKVLLAHGIEVVLKPHPRDSFSTIEQCESISVFSMKGIDVESLCAYSHPKCIIGYATTALSSVGSLLGITAICITDLLDNRKLSSAQININKEVKQLCGNFVLYPKSIEQLIKIVEKNEN